MKVTDPSRFFSLVSSLAKQHVAPRPSSSTGVVLTTLTVVSAVVSACGAHGTDGASADIRIPAQPKPPERTVLAKPKGSASAAVNEVGAPSEEGDSDDEPDDDVASAACGEVDVRQVTRSSGACNDMTAPPALCTACGTKGFGASKCATYKQYLKPKVAKAALDCLAKLSSRCDSCAIYACGDRAMKSSCPDATADAECRALLKTCPRMSFDECSRYMSALLPSGRVKLKACMTGCSLYSCAEGL